MLLSKEVQVTVNYKNIMRYLDLGYKFEYFINKKGNPATKRGTVLIVKVEDLDRQCGAFIEYECDYCHENIQVRFCDYMRHKEHIGEIDACKDCGNTKLGDINYKKYGTRSPFGRKEVKEKSNNTVKERYGVDNVFQLEKVRDKIKETNIEKYGYESYTQTDEYKERAKQTCLDKYGYDNASKSPEIINKIKEVHIERFGGYYSSTEEGKDKYKQFCLNNYGVENLFQSEEIKDKIKDTMINKYGTPYLMQIPSEAKRRTLLAMKTKESMGVLPSSRQQEYLHKIYGGIKNHVVSNCALDVALLEDKIDIEGDFSGHELRVKFGECTQEEFENKEVKRKYFLKSKGWKDFRIISRKDNLPSDEILLQMLDIAKEWFENEHSWIKFDIDNSTYETSKGILDYNYGKLRKIKDEDLKVAN